MKPVSRCIKTPTDRLKLESRLENKQFIEPSDVCEPIICGSCCKSEQGQISGRQTEKVTIKFHWEREVFLIAQTTIA